MTDPLSNPSRALQAPYRPERAMPRMAHRIWGVLPYPDGPCVGMPVFVVYDYADETYSLRLTGLPSLDLNRTPSPLQQNHFAGSRDVVDMTLIWSHLLRLSPVMRDHVMAYLLHVPLAWPGGPDEYGVVCEGLCEEPLPGFLHEASGDHTPAIRVAISHDHRVGVLVVRPVREGVRLVLQWVAPTDFSADAVGCAEATADLTVEDFVHGWIPESASLAVHGLAAHLANPQRTTPDLITLVFLQQLMDLREDDPSIRIHGEPLAQMLEERLGVRRGDALDEHVGRLLRLRLHLHALQQLRTTQSAEQFQDKVTRDAMQPLLHTMVDALHTLVTVGGPLPEVTRIQVCAALHRLAHRSTDPTVQALSHPAARWTAALTVLGTRPAADLRFNDALERALAHGARLLMSRQEDMERPFDTAVLNFVLPSAAVLRARLVQRVGGSP